MYRDDLQEITSNYRAEGGLDVDGCRKGICGKVRLVYKVASCCKKGAGGEK